MGNIGERERVDDIDRMARRVLGVVGEGGGRGGNDAAGIVDGQRKP